MTVALDTNILAYIEGINGPEKEAVAADLYERLPVKETVLPAQALGELYNVLVRKARWSAVDAHRTILSWRDACTVAPTTETAITTAASIATIHRIRIWDSVMLAVAAEAGCRLLLSEDFQDGFTWAGVTVTNPFTPQRHPHLNALLSPE